MAKQKSKSEVLKLRTKKKEKRIVLSLFKWCFILFILFGLLGCAGLAGLYYYLSQDLPKINTMKDYRPATVTSVFSDDGRKIGEFYEERRIVIPLSQMPKNLINAFVAAEDSRFREHPGIDILSIIRASFKNFKAGTIVQGGSTITQQVTKSFLLTPEKTYERKIKEAILAYRIEKKFTKDEILFLYLNQIYLGHGAYGVEAASENYFGKHTKDLNLAECSMLAGLPQAPSRYSPFRFPDRAKQRQIYVLNRMKEDGLITNLEATESIDLKLDIKPRKNWFIERVPCYTEHVRRYVENHYGKDALYNQGLQIHTAVNIELQKIGRDAVNKGLIELDRRTGYRGPLKNISTLQIENFCARISEKIGNKLLEKGNIYEGVVLHADDENNTTTVRVGNFHGVIKLETMTWARKPDFDVAYYEAIVKKPSQVFKPGDIILVKLLNDIVEDNEVEFILEQEPVAQSALLSIEAETGHVKTMIGGRDYINSQFNRAYQSRRQPGSAFKPIIYAAALDKGYTAASTIIDSPVVYEDTERDFIWKPRNYKEKFFGPTLFREALVKSRNVVTIKILKDIGIDYVIDYSRRLGITSDISQDLSIALGSSGLSLLELVNAYSVFSNLGYLIEPVFITKIYDRDGNLLETSKLIRKKVIDMSTAYIMTNIMESVVKSGTAWRIKALKRPVAGKTGTTNNLFDAWFLGYTPRYTTGVWVGLDQEAPLGKGETGSRAASPIWLEFMKNALEGKPARTFNVPEGIVFAKIDAKTGLLPIEESEETIFECFKEGTVPTEHTQKPDTASDSEALFKQGI
ncbi:MAG: PBP1A family penicillin-binding protein [Proteobacteria bacterium]|nr:PBP1A family penicillin-binding protein [Pseudomonadota bacterium]MBU1582365.1 PBP1A family penicillin-binding protein [Pseudomonadota bacterium]MBU2627141.1 PBP1A family penicillin-binding protein [Pseudomonadota bacterium]